jgi:hypothetical protein
MVLPVRAGQYRLHPYGIGPYGHQANPPARRFVFVNSIRFREYVRNRGVFQATEQA